MPEPRPEKPIEVRLRDPLREVTRKERRNLLAASAVSYGIVKTGLVPTEIATLGIKLSPAHRSELLMTLAIVVGYFLVAFVIYAVSDWLAGRWALQLAIEAETPRQADELKRDLEARMEATSISKEAEQAHQARADFDAAVRRLARRFAPATTPILMVRNAFEFAIPVGAGTYALISLINAAH